VSEPSFDAELATSLEALDLDYLRQDLPKLVKAMKDGGDRIKSISKSLRTFSRSDSDDKQKFNLHAPNISDFSTDLYRLTNKS
jgi:signal transduction histidine kinase